MADDVVQALRQPVRRGAPGSSQAGKPRTQWLGYVDDTKRYPPNGGNPHGTAPLEIRLIRPQAEHLVYDDDTKPPTEADYLRAQRSFGVAACSTGISTAAARAQRSEYIVLVLDSAKSVFSKLAELGYTVIDNLADPRAKQASVLVVRSKTKVDPAFFAANNLPRLIAAIRGGVGTDNLDIPHCKELGIQVFNTPEASTVAVAELAVCLTLGAIEKQRRLANGKGNIGATEITISGAVEAPGCNGAPTISVTHHLNQPDAAVFALLDAFRGVTRGDGGMRKGADKPEQGEWLKPKLRGQELRATELSLNGASPVTYGTFTALEAIPVNQAKDCVQLDFRLVGLEPGPAIGGKTIGIIGLGRIGRLVAQKLLALGAVEVLAFDPGLRQDSIPSAMPIQLVDGEEGLNELLLKSDVTLLHALLTKETDGMIGSKAFGLMKPGAVLVNASRGKLVDLSALRVALSTGNLFFATDVYHAEPKNGGITETQAILASFENTLLTPHIGAETHPAQERIAEEAAAKCDEVLGIVT